MLLLTKFGHRRLDCRLSPASAFRTSEPLITPSLSYGCMAHLSVEKGKDGGREKNLFYHLEQAISCFLDLAEQIVQKICKYLLSSLPLPSVSEAEHFHRCVEWQSNFIPQTLGLGEQLNDMQIRACWQPLCLYSRMLGYCSKTDRNSQEGSVL